jgi:hypothetical protein
MTSGLRSLWRDQVRHLGVDGCCAADNPLDRFGRGDIYLVVRPARWSYATEIIENLDLSSLRQINPTSEDAGKR